VSVLAPDEEGDYVDTGMEIVVPPGASSVQVPITIPGDDEYVFPPTTLYVVVYGRVNAMASHYIGQITVLDDEPAPVLTIDATTVSTEEGGLLSWTIRASRPIPISLVVTGVFQDVSPDAAADVNDFTREQVKIWEFDEPPAAGKLAGSAFVFVLPAGSTVLTLSFETLDDVVPEGAESVEFRVLGGSVLLPETVLTGVINASD
jgi:hypothetical protein